MAVLPLLIMVFLNLRIALDIRSAKVSYIYNSIILGGGGLVGIQPCDGIISEIVCVLTIKALLYKKQTTLYYIAHSSKYLKFQFKIKKLLTNK